MNAYSKDLRSKVLEAVDYRGLPRREAVSVLGVCLATPKRWLKCRREGGDLTPRPSTGRKRRILATREEERALWAQSWRRTTTPPRWSATVRAVGRGPGDRGVGLYDEPGDPPQARVDPKKRTLGAAERDEAARAAWRDRLEGVDHGRLVFVDESSTNVALTPRYAGAPEGERACGKAPRNWGKNVTLISSITPEGIGPSLSIEGPSDGESFGLYLGEPLCPALKRGQIVVMDNPSVHEGAWVREPVEARGASVLLLPPSTRRTSTP